MYQLRGFISIPSLIDNTLGVVAPLGELSLWSQTFTKERGEYEFPDVPDFVLESIYSVDSITGKVALNTALADRVLTLAKWIHDYLQTQSAPISTQLFTEEVLTNFPGEVTYFNFGELISDGTITLPEWFSYRNSKFPDNDIKVWFSDNAFSTQFEEYEIITVAPLDNLDDFFLAPSVVQAKLNARTPTMMMDMIQNAKNKNPDTLTRVEMFNYDNIQFPGVIFPTNWAVIIYGANGDNLDSIKDAIVSYVLANSTHTRQEWAAILPDLFKRTEFIISPDWFSYAIPNKTVQAGVYSPVVKPKDSLTLIQYIVKDYDPQYIADNITFFGNSFKSINMTCVGGADNRNGKNYIRDYFPDYINVNTSSLDFNRMDVSTQNWVLLLEQMLIVAENMTEFSSIPLNMRRIHRAGFVYISSIYQNVQYLVSAKMNLTLLNNYVAAGYVVPGEFMKLIEGV